MRNGPGGNALIFGIIGVASGIAPEIFFVTGAVGLVAVVLGTIGRLRVGKGEASNGGVALTGLILGMIAMGLAVWGMVGVLRFVGDAVAENNRATPSAVAGSKGSTSGVTADQATKTFGPGAIVREGQFALKILSVRRESALTEILRVRRPKGSYVVVRVLIKNLGTSLAPFNGEGSVVQDGDARTYRMDWDATPGQNSEDGEGLNDPINPDQRAIRTLVYDLPRESTPTLITLFSTKASGGTLLRLG